MSRGYPTQGDGYSEFIVICVNIMLRHLFPLALLGSILFYACSPPDNLSVESNLAEKTPTAADLIGVWTLKSAKIRGKVFPEEVGFKDITPHHSIVRIYENGTYSSDITVAVDGSIEHQEGKWLLENDSISFIKANPYDDTTIYHIVMRRDVVTATGWIDLDNNGSDDHLYIGVSEKLQDVSEYIIEDSLKQ